MPSVAVESDLSASLKEIGASRLLLGAPYTLEVMYYRQNTAGLFALVECRVPTDAAESILLELIVTSSEKDKYASLEQISAAA